MASAMPPPVVSFATDRELSWTGSAQPARRPMARAMARSRMIASGAVADPASARRAVVARSQASSPVRAWRRRSSASARPARTSCSSRLSSLGRAGAGRRALARGRAGAGGPGPPGAPGAPEREGRGGRLRLGGLARAGLGALGPQQLLGAADRVALLVEEGADLAQQLDVLGPVVAPAAAALERANLGELALPEAQDVLRDVEPVRDLADGAEGRLRLLRPRLVLVGLDRSGRLPGGERGTHEASPFAPLIRSFSTWDALKTSTLRGKIGTSWPVFGFRPTRCPFWRTAKVPNEEIFTVPSRSSETEISSRIASTRSADSLRERPTSW